jgi:hypothetical protein
MKPIITEIHLQRSEITYRLAIKIDNIQTEWLATVVRTSIIDFISDIVFVGDCNLKKSAKNKIHKLIQDALINTHNS